MELPTQSEPNHLIHYTHAPYWLNKIIKPQKDIGVSLAKHSIDSTQNKVLQDHESFELKHSVLESFYKKSFSTFKITRKRHVYILSKHTLAGSRNIGYHNITAFLNDAAEDIDLITVLAIFKSLYDVYPKAHLACCTEVHMYIANLLNRPHEIDYKKYFTLRTWNATRSRITEPLRTYRDLPEAAKNLLGAFHNQNKMNEVVTTLENRIKDTDTVLEEAHALNNIITFFRSITPDVANELAVKYEVDSPYCQKNIELLRALGLPVSNKALLEFSSRMEIIIKEFELNQLIKVEEVLQANYSLLRNMLASPKATLFPTPYTPNITFGHIHCTVLHIRRLATLIKRCKYNRSPEVISVLGKLREEFYKIVKDGPARHRHSKSKMALTVPTENRHKHQVRRCRAIHCCYTHGCLTLFEAAQLRGVNRLMHIEIPNQDWLTAVPRRCPHNIL